METISSTISCYRCGTTTTKKEGLRIQSGQWKKEDFGTYHAADGWYELTVPSLNFHQRKTSQHLCPKCFEIIKKAKRNRNQNIFTFEGVRVAKKWTCDGKGCKQHITFDVISQNQNENQAAFSQGWIEVNGSGHQHLCPQCSEKFVSSTGEQ